MYLLNSECTYSIFNLKFNIRPLICIISDLILFFSGGAKNVKSGTNDASLFCCFSNSLFAFSNSFVAEFNTFVNASNSDLPLVISALILALASDSISSLFFPPISWDFSGKNIFLIIFPTPPIILFVSSILSIYNSEKLFSDLFKLPPPVFVWGFSAFHFVLADSQSLYIGINIFFLFFVSLVSFFVLVVK